MLTKRTTRWMVGCLIGCAATGLFTAAGCGPADGLSGIVPVRGKVTLDGEPLASGEIRYMPTAPEGRQARGSIESGGRFELSTLRPGDGALPGEYRIVVLAPADESTEDAAARRSNENAGRRRRTFAAEGGAPSLVPLRYTNPESSGLTDTVGDGSRESVVLELSSEADEAP